MTNPTPLPTSRAIKDIVTAFASHEHVIVAGRQDELMLVRGEAHPITGAVVTVAAPFAVVALIDAANGIQVLKGNDLWQPDDNVRRDPLDAAADLLRHPTQSAVVLYDQAGILLQDPNHHDEADRTRVAVLEQAMADASTNGPLRNTAVLLTPRLEDIPAPLREGKQRPRAVTVDAPTRLEREHYLRSRLASTGDGSTPVTDLATAYALRSDGLALADLHRMLTYAASTRTPVSQPSVVLRRYQFGDAPDYWSGLKATLPAIGTQLRRRVIGQEEAVAAVEDALSAAALNLSLNGNPDAREAPPRLTALMLGPTGVGKTELAKALATCLYGEPDAYTRIDMGAFSLEHSVDRLTGAPPGYIGYDAGGELTNAVRRRPHQVILLDEVEKAHPRVWDRLLSVIDDGRIADAQGRVTYFSECVLLMTSNLGAAALLRQATEARPGSSGGPDLAALDPAIVRRTLLDAAERYFTYEMDPSRMEVWGRLRESAVVFQPLRPDMVGRIATNVLDGLSFGRGPALVYDRDSALQHAQRLMATPASARLGGRALRNALRADAQRLAAWVVRNGHAEAGKVTVRYDEHGGMYIECDGTPGYLPPRA